MFNRILIGIDGDEGGRDALALARPLAPSGTDLVLPHVRDTAAGIAAAATGGEHPATAGHAMLEGARSTLPGPCRIRPVQPGDEPLVARLLGGLDEQSRYRRWFTGAVDVGKAASWAAHPERAAAVGLLALAGAEPVGHAVLVPVPGGRTGEVAFEVAAAWRHHGIAGALLSRLVSAAADLGLREVYAEVLSENADMLAVLREHGEHAEHRDGSTLTVRLPVPARATSTLPAAGDHPRSSPQSVA